MAQQSRKLVGRRGEAKGVALGQRTSSTAGGQGCSSVTNNRSATSASNTPQLNDSNAVAGSVRSTEAASVQKKKAVRLVPGLNGAMGKKFLSGMTFTHHGKFPDVDGCSSRVIQIIQSFGGKAISRFSSKTDYFLPGQNTPKSKFRDAQERSIQIISFFRLKMVLLGLSSFESLQNSPKLTSKLFAGNSYMHVIANEKMKPPVGTAGIAGDTGDLSSLHSEENGQKQDRDQVSWEYSKERAFLVRLLMDDSSNIHGLTAREIFNMCN